MGRLDALFDVAETPVGLLATGLDGLWTSQDGVEWQPYARDSVVIFDAFSKIAASNVGIVVAFPRFEDAASWSSPDGVEWTSIEGLRLTTSRWGNPLTASNERFLAIDVDGRVVSSIDGTTWQTVEDLPVAPRGSGGILLVEATPFGFYAAHDNRLWRSPDGVEWTQAPAASIDGEVISIAGMQTDLVAVTFVRDPGELRIWHTTDGTMWTEVQVLPQGSPSCTRVGASDSGFLVATLHGDIDGFPAAWFSEDGRLWARVPNGPADDQRGLRSGGCYNELIPYQDGFLSVTDHGGRNHTVWRHEP